MEVSYQITAADYFEASLPAKAKERRIRFLLASSISAVMILGAVLVGTARQRLALILAAAVVVGCVFVIDRLKTVFLKRSVAKAAITPNTFRVELSEKGMGTPKGRLEPWSSFTRYSETSNDFVLFRSGSIEAIIPKRALELSGIEAVRSLLSAHLSQ
jgi:hypothetical protein